MEVERGSRRRLPPNELPYQFRGGYITKTLLTVLWFRPLD